MKSLLRGASLLLVVVAALFATACNNSTVRQVETAPLVKGDPAMPEDQLLDIGVRLFDPGVDKLKEDEFITAPEIRLAEARFMPTLLAETLQNSGNWGAARVVPKDTALTDVVVDGRIVESTGDKLVLEITASDVGGAVWYTRSYEGYASKFSYEGKQQGDPFQDVYNRIANDLANQRARLSPAQAARLRQITELRFAESFSPEAFGGYLGKDARGQYSVLRLPAGNDPMLERVRKIRQRDNLFVDTLQDYYGGFSKQMSVPYEQWRKESYVEVQEYEKLRKQSTARTVAGVAAVIGGILAITNNTSGDTSRVVSNVGGAAAVMGGATLIKSGFSKRAEAKMHAESLRELGASLTNDVQPQMIELDDRTITLTGTVQDQYGQWRDILHGIYRTETGAP